MVYINSAELKPQYVGLICIISSHAISVLRDNLMGKQEITFQVGGAKYQVQSTVNIYLDMGIIWYTRLLPDLTIRVKGEAGGERVGQRTGFSPARLAGGPAFGGPGQTRSMWCDIPTIQSFINYSILFYSTFNVNVVVNSGFKKFYPEAPTLEESEIWISNKKLGSNSELLTRFLRSMLVSISVSNIFA